MAPTRDTQAELEAGIRRIHQALAEARGPQAQLAQEVFRHVSTRVLERVDRSLQRHEEREARRARWRRRRFEGRPERGVAEAVVFGAGAALLAAFAITQPHLWWLVFPAFGFGMSAAGILSRRSRALEEGRETAAAGQLPASSAPVSRAPEAAAQAPAVPAPAETTSDPKLLAIAARLARIDGVCGKLLAELKAAPEHVRQLLGKPQETVEALRAASHELARRERELRAAITDEDDQRLRQERADLEGRVAAEADEVVRGRLEGAIEALDAQLAARGSLGTAAARIEAEGTRILYSLENLRARLLRTMAADSTSDVAGDGLRDGLEQLSREMDSVATALEEVQATELGRRSAAAGRTVSAR